MSNLTQPHFQDADKARIYLEAQVWPNGPVCPHCGVESQDHYKLEGKSTRPGLYKCKDCRRPFTVTVGTVFERSKIPLNKWLLATYLICSSKKGMSAHQLHRTMGVTYKTAWFMCHRIREAMHVSSGPQLGGGGQPVEVDETYWGNKKPRGHFKKRGSGGHHQMKVVSLVERDGNKHSFHVKRVSHQTLRPILIQQIAERAHLMTDEHGAYEKLGHHFAKHSTVNHRAGEYSRGNVTTNTVESSFALLKRGLIGTFHHIGEQHIQRYAHEFDFRWNHRKTTDAERSDSALKNIQGKRLTYRRTDPRPPRSPRIEYTG